MRSSFSPDYTGGFLLLFSNKNRQVGEVMVKTLARFDWRVVGMLFHNHDVSKGLGHSPCYFILSDLFSQFGKQGHKSVYKSFDETNSSVNLTQLLLEIGKISRSESPTNVIKRSLFFL